MERTVTVKKAKEDRRLMSDVRRQEEERRCLKTKETMQK